MIYTDYFVLEQANIVQTGRTSGELYKTDKIPDLSGLDYIQKDCLVSDRLKQLFEKYLPYNEWELAAFIDLDKSQNILKQIDYNSAPDKLDANFDKILPELEKTQEVFWKLNVLEYIPSESTVFGGNGLVKTLYLSDTPPPAVVFRVKSPPNYSPRIFSTIVHLSVAESILRRKYTGANLVRV